MMNMFYIFMYEFIVGILDNGRRNICIVYEKWNLQKVYQLLS